MPRPKTPEIAVDAIIRLHQDPYQLVLIERKNPPFGVAIPGGFVDVGERLERAVIREAKEETSLDIRLEFMLGCYSDPARDERGHTVTAVYIADADGVPMAADDAKSICLVDPRDRELVLAFDHRLVLDDYLHWLEHGEAAPLRP